MYFGIVRQWLRVPTVHRAYQSVVAKHSRADRPLVARGEFPRVALRKATMRPKPSARFTKKQGRKPLRLPPFPQGSVPNTVLALTG